MYLPFNDINKLGPECVCLCPNQRPTMKMT